MSVREKAKCQQMFHDGSKVSSSAALSLKGSFGIAHMHFSNWTKRFFEMQGSDILIRAL